MTARYPTLHRYIEPDGVLDLQGATKNEVLLELTDRIQAHPHVMDGEAFRRAIFDREELLSTGIGLGVAVPHAKIPSVTDYCVVVGRAPAGIEYDAIDGEPVRLVFMIGAAEHQVGEFVSMLAKVVRLIRDDSRRQQLLEAEIPGDFMEVLRAYDEADG